MGESENKQYADHPQAPEFEEEGKENLSSEGDETDVKERTYLAKPPKIQQEKFNDLSRKFSRNPGFSQVGNFKTDVPTEDTTKLHSAKFLSQKSVASKEAEEGSSCGGHVIPTGIISRAKRSMQKTSKIPHNLNRSRNAGRNNHSRNTSNLERVTSSILTDKLRDTLENSKKKGSRYSMAPNHPKSGEKSNILKEDDQLKEPESGHTRLKKVYQKAYYKNKVNNQVLGDIIKNNNGQNFGSKGNLQGEKPHSKDKYKRIHSKNTKNHSLNNKENHAKNQLSSFDEFRDKNSSTEVYNLNQYCSAANLNAFGSKNFSLPKNMILSKNRSRDNTGFGSPTMRRVEGEKEENKGAFDSIMAKHGLLKDLNNLN